MDIGKWQLAMTPSPQYFSILISLLGLFRLVAGQRNSTASPNTASSTPVIILVIVTTVVFFISLFFVLFFQFKRSTIEVSTTRAVRSTSTRVRRKGLDPAILETFHTLLYSDVKEHKVGKDTLECAVCLSELEDTEMLRLLMPKCNHVFHRECIDRWLELHTTCPVCRTNLAVEDDHLSFPSTVDAREDNLQPQQEEVEEESVIGIPETENSAPVHYRHSKSTSAMETVGRRMERLYSYNDRERFTLRLPDHIRRELFSGKLSESSRFFSMEQSSRRGYRREDGEGTSSGIRGWSLKIRSDRWAFLSSFNWRNGGDGAGVSEEGGGDSLETGMRLSREKSSKRKRFGSLDCLGNDALKSDDEETLPLAVLP